jgi:endonuclease III
MATMLGRTAGLSWCVYLGGPMGRSSTPSPPKTRPRQRGSGRVPLPLSPSPLRGVGARKAAVFRRRLLAWFSKHGRDLPWRRTRDPYHVTVSEFMLQQTQVSRVLAYYPRFLERFPTVEHLAAARPKAVMEQWDGLGYYARARNLHALAREIVRRHDGTTPREPAELIKLPGVGRYTAGAVASFAYEKPVAAVDTNVGRVIGGTSRGAGSRDRAGKDGVTPLLPPPLWPQLLDGGLRGPCASECKRAWSLNCPHGARRWCA